MGQQPSTQALESARQEVTRLRQELSAQQARSAGQMQAIRHGISNQLQILASSAAAARQRSTTLELTHFAQEVLGKAQAIANVHRALARGRGRIVLTPLLDELCAALAAMFTDPNITVRVDGDRASVSADMAFTLALIASELVTNAYKYAFANRERGTVQVRIQSDADHIILSVVDDGRGLPPAFRADATGLATVEGMAQALGGSMALGHGPGTVVTLTFPCQSQSPRRRRW